MSWELQNWRGRDLRGPLVSMITVVVLIGLLASGEALLHGGDDAEVLDGRLALIARNQARCFAPTRSARGLPLLSTVTGASRWQPAARVVPRSPTPGTPRLAVVGESSGGILEEALDHAVLGDVCQHAPEILPCATPGGDLSDLERRFDEVAEYQPSTILVVFGHNLFCDNRAEIERLRLRRATHRSGLDAHPVDLDGG